MTNSRLPRKGKQNPLHSGRQRWEIEWDDETAGGRMEGPPHKKSLARQQPCPRAGSGNKVIWPAHS